jgi:hypothetical protein
MDVDVRGAPPGSRDHVRERGNDEVNYNIVLFREMLTIMD